MVARCGGAPTQGRHGPKSRLRRLLFRSRTAPPRHAYGPSAGQQVCQSRCNAALTRAQGGMWFPPCRAPSPARRPKGGAAVETDACPPSGIESDGALIAICALKSDAFTPANYTAYRLAAGASEWTALGGVPSSGCVIAPNRIMWCTNELGDTWLTTPHG